jgi:hypothetical protein
LTLPRVVDQFGVYMGIEFAEERTKEFR